MIRENAKKLVTLIRREGVRRGFDIALEAWMRNRAAFSTFPIEQLSFVTLPNRPETLSCPKSLSSIRINWIVESFGKNGGGINTILRTIYQLEQLGHTQTIYVLLKETASIGAVRKAASRYFPIRSRIEALSGNIEDCDALVATSWKTAYYVRSISNAARKFYFVQDMEDRFHAESSLSQFARETYRWGFYGVTAGPWIAEELKRNFGMPAAPFRFSFDRTIYKAADRECAPSKVKRVLFYARPITERRGFELGLLALSLAARQIPEFEAVLLGYSGKVDNLPFRAIPSGLVPPKELADIYRSCDAALCLSLTNLSLLPLELMAIGCPVISNDGSNVEWLLNDTVAELTRPTPEALAKGIVKMLQDSELRAKRIDAGRILAASTNWADETKKIEAAFFNGLGVSASS